MRNQRKGGKRETKGAKEARPVMAKDRKPHGNGAPLDKLAQPVRTFGQDSQVIDNQSGPLDTLKRRARSKWYTYGTLVRLANIDAPTLYPDVPNREALTRHYWRGTHCAELLYREGSTYYAHKYCNGRVCNICGRIRAGKLWNAWHGVVRELQGVHFTTLTRQSVSAYSLRDTIREMARECTLIIRYLRHHKGIDVNGIRKIECTYSDKRGDFHPHIHILHDGGPEVAKAIIHEWMRRYPAHIVHPHAQHTRPVDDAAYAEVFKYAAKQWDKKKGNDGSRIRVDVTALDVMVQALWGLRTCQSFGAIRKTMAKVEEQEDGMTLEARGVTLDDANLATKEKPHSSRCLWDGMDWIDQCDNTPVTGYIPPSESIMRYTMSPQPRDGCGGRQVDHNVNLEHCMNWMKEEEQEIQAMPRMRYYIRPPDNNGWKPMDDAPLF